jgi:hypothetical protein
MKIRSGFVSNSSSSSFIIRKNIFPNNKTVALSMVDDYIETYKSDYDEDDWFINKFKMFKDSLNNIDDDCNIMFNSTNYDTFITNLDDNYIHVATCNNIQWDVESYACGQLPDDLSNNIKEHIEFYNSNESYLDDGNYDSDKKTSKLSPFRNIKYFKIDSGFFIKKTKPYQSCKKCYHELYIVGKRKLCLNCDNDYILRSLKLSKIKKTMK